MFIGGDLQQPYGSANFMRALHEAYMSRAGSLAVTLVTPLSAGYERLYT